MFLLITSSRACGLFSMCCIFIRINGPSQGAILDIFSVGLSRSTDFEETKAKRIAGKKYGFQYYYLFFIHIHSFDI